MIVPELKIAFIHIPKCAGSSVEEAMLEAIGVGPDPTDEQKKHFRIWTKDVTWSTHATLKRLEQEIDLTDWTVFAVTRCPYKRATSEFRYQHQEGYAGSGDYMERGFTDVLQSGDLWGNATAQHALSQQDMYSSLKGIKCELFDIDNDIQSLEEFLTFKFGTKVKVPWTNRTLGQDKHTPFTRRLVREYWIEDFNRSYRKEINVLLAGNKSSQGAIATTLNSVLQNTDKQVNAVVLCRDWQHEGFQNGRLSVEFVPFKGHKDTPKQWHSSANDMLYYLPYLYSWDRCLMLEWDQLVVGSIDDYYNIDFEGKNFVTATEIIDPDGRGLRGLWEWKGQRKNMEDIFSEETLDYVGFDGGSHVIDLKRYMENHKFLEMERALYKLNGEDHLAKIGVFHGHVHHVPSKYNTFPETVNSQHLPPTVNSPLMARILHFVGSNKPWNSKRRFSELWYRYQTTWEELNGFKD